MTALDEFLEAFDRAKGSSAADAIVNRDAGAGAIDIGDQAIEQWGAAMAPYYARLAERGGFTTDELSAHMERRSCLIAAIVLARGMTTRHMQLEIHRALRDYAADAFLAGVAYQQQRDLPNLEETP